MLVKNVAGEIARTGVTAQEARDAGIDAVVTTFDSTTKAGYWPEATPMRVRALADRATRRIIGAQIIGGPSAGKRIDTLAMAFIGIRLVYIAMYLMDLATLRSLVWGAGFAVCIGILSLA